jgi:hypothetical protein
MSTTPASLMQGRRSSVHWDSLRTASPARSSGEFNGLVSDSATFDVVRERQQQHRYTTIMLA